MKNVPNILSLARIVLAILLLLFFDNVTSTFLGIFLLAMLTDLLDGKIARKFDACSQLGSLLDTVADLLLDASLIKIVFSMGIMSKELTLWLIIALSIGAISPLINYIRHKKVFFIHSLPCKACMWLLVGVPFAIQFGFVEAYIVLTLSLVTLSMVEIVAMSLILKEPDPNAKSIYSVLKQNKDIKHKNLESEDVYV